MSESASSSPSFDQSDKPSSNTEVILLYPELTNGTEQRPDREIVWSILDSRMKATDIENAVHAWNPTRVYYGKQNADRPRAATEWMLVQAHVSVDASEEIELREKRAEMERRQKRGLTLTNEQRKLKDITPEQQGKLAIADAVNRKIIAAERYIESEKDKGMSHLLDVLDDLEAYVMDISADANVVRLFNAIDDKTGGRNRELILARRLIVVMLADELHKGLTR